MKRQEFVRRVCRGVLSAVACVAMVTTAFGGYNELSRTLGEGTFDGTTLTVSAPVYYGSGFPAHCNQRGWYAGVTIKWAQEDTKANGFKISVTTSGNLHNVAEFAPMPTTGTSDQSPDGSGVSCTIWRKTAISTRYITECTWYVWLTETDAYKLVSDGIDSYDATLSAGSEKFYIKIPLANLVLKDGDDVRWFPAVAVKDDGEKVWGDIDRAFAEFVSGTLKLEADVTSSSDLNLLSTFDLNGKTLTVAGGKVAFKTASRVEAASAGQIVTSGGNVSAELGSTFTFEPDAAWLASGLTVEENEGVWTVVYDHVCDWGMSVAGDTLTAVCTGTGTCKYGNLLTLVLSAADTVYDGTPKGAAINASAAATFIAATGAAIGDVRYVGFTSAGGSYDSTEAPTDAGSYMAKVAVTDVKHGSTGYTLIASYAISPRPLTAMEIDPVLFPYDGETHAVGIVSVKADGLDATYVENAASVRSAVGSGTVDTFSVVIVDGTGNFSGSLTNEWLVLAPKGDPLAAGGGFVGAAEAGYKVTDGTNLTVTTETQFAYDAETETGTATMTVKWPHEQIRKTALVEYVWGANCTQDGTARVRLGTNGVAGAWLDGTDVVGGAFADAGFTGAEGKGTYLSGVATENEYSYFDTMTWRIPLSIAEIDAAKAEGKDSFKFTLTLFSKPYGTADDRIRNLTGVRETTYVLTVPLDSIRFYDKFGNLVYPRPEHAHEWTFAGDGTDTITATCTNGVPPCTIPGAAVAIGLVAESKAYDGTPFAASVTNVEVFAAAIQRDVTGTVEYYDTNGVRLATAPKLTGDYVAKFPVEAVGMTLEKAFSITKPSGGYTDGWELARQGVDESKWVRYDTFADAAAVAADGDKVLYRGGMINQKWYDFTSDADITVDLNGQTLMHDADGDSGFENDGDGTVTIVNADLLQPKGTWGQNVDFVGTAGKTGAFILGEGVVFRNQATTEGRRMTLEVADVDLEIVGGKYQIRGFSPSEGTVVSVKGGLFWSNFNPSAHVPYPYAVRELDGEYKYEVYYRQPITPGEPVAYDTAEAASNAMTAAILEPRADVSAALGSDDARETYRNMFEFDVVPTSDDKWAVAAFLTPADWTNVVESAQEATRQIPVADIAAWQSGDNPIPVPLTNCVPGFFYSLYDGASVTNIRATMIEKDLNVLCGADKEVLFPEVTKPIGGLNAGFFSIGVLEAPGVKQSSDGPVPVPPVPHPGPYPYVH